MNKACSFALVAVMAVCMIQGCPSDQNATESKSASGNIVVRKPQPNALVTSPVTVTGKARVFEAALSARVVGSDGRPLGTANFMASGGAPEWGEFQAQVSFRVPSGMTQGTVEVYSNSPKDGSVINLVRIPVRFGSR